MVIVKRYKEEKHRAKYTAKKQMELDRFAGVKSNGKKNKNKNKNKTGFPGH